MGLIGQFGSLCGDTALVQHRKGVMFATDKELKAKKSRGIFIDVAIVLSYVFRFVIGCVCRQFEGECRILAGRCG